jgi:hypothetical protein
MLWRQGDLAQPFASARRPGGPCHGLTDINPSSLRVRCGGDVRSPAAPCHAGLALPCLAQPCRAAPCLPRFARPCLAQPSHALPSHAAPRLPCLMSCRTPPSRFKELVRRPIVAGRGSVATSSHYHTATAARKPFLDIRQFDAAPESAAPAPLPCAARRFSRRDSLARARRAASRSSTDARAAILTLSAADGVGIGASAISTLRGRPRGLPFGQPPRRFTARGGAAWASSMAAGASVIVLSRSSTSWRSWSSGTCASTVYKADVAGEPGRGRI